MLMTTDPGRSGSRSNLWFRHYRLRRRTVGTPVDHDGHVPSRVGTCSHAADVGPVSVLPAVGFNGGGQRKPKLLVRRRLRRIRRTTSRKASSISESRTSQLKSIANNEEIDVIHAKYEAQLTPIREKLNAALKKSWEGWEVPREADSKWRGPAADLHAEWWQLRLARQKEIDASIARRADTELLYDQPYEDSKRVRVSGPFTVESLSPHRVLKADEERPANETDGAREAEGDFVTRILDYLRKSGVQNTVKQERLTFDRLEPFAGEWIQASGEYRTMMEIRSGWR